VSDFDVQQFGIIGADDLVEGLDYTNSRDCSDLVSRVHDIANARGFRRVRFRRGIIRTPTLPLCPEVIFIGDCVLAGSTRKRCIPESAGPLQLSSDIIPSQHLASFHAAVDRATRSNPAKICVVGDSWTVGGNSLAFSETWVGHLTRRLQETYGNAPIQICNLGIGGAGWADFHADAAPPLASTRPFYTDLSKPWRHYAEQHEPDWIIFALGINDGLQFDVSKMRTCVARVKAWRTPPAISFCINATPSLGAREAVDPAYIEGRDQCAGYLRSFATRFGYGFFDWHRAQLGAREGIDVRSNVLKLVAANQEIMFPYTWPAPTNDFSFRANIRYGSEMWATGPFPVQLSSREANLFKFERDERTGKIAVSADVGERIPSIERTLTEVMAPNGFIVLDLLCKGSYFQLSIDGSVVWEGVVERFGGTVTPVIGGPGQVELGAPLIHACISEPRLHMPTVIDTELWGGRGDPPYLKNLDPYGGNGHNHLSSIGSQIIHGPLFDATRFI
jgi:hypothetical protein